MAHPYGWTGLRDCSAKIRRKGNGFHPGLFAGFTPIVWAVVSIKGVGGLLNAACIKHADNILRSYATAASIVLTFAVRIVVTGEAPALVFVQGAGMVLLSVILYSRGAAS